MTLLAEFQIDLLNEMGDKIFQTWFDNWIDFSRWKKGPIRKENSVLCTTSLRFSFFFYNYQQTPYIFHLSQFSSLIFNTIRHQLFCSPIWLPESNKSDRNRTGDSMGRQASLNSIPPTWQIIIKLFSTVCTAKFTFISFLSCRDLWA